MTQTKLHLLNYRNAVIERDRHAQDVADARAEGRIHCLEGRTTRSGRTQIWTATPDTVTVRYTRRDGTWAYRDITRTA